MKIFVDLPVLRDSGGRRRNRFIRGSCRSSSLRLPGRSPRRSFALDAVPFGRIGKISFALCLMYRQIRRPDTVCHINFASEVVNLLVDFRLNPCRLVLPFLRLWEIISQDSGGFSDVVYWGLLSRSDHFIAIAFSLLQHCQSIVNWSELSANPRWRSR